MCTAEIIAFFLPLFLDIPWHMEFLGQGADLSHSCGDAGSFNPLCWARDQTCVLVLQRYSQSRCAMRQLQDHSIFFFFFRSQLLHQKKLWRFLTWVDDLIILTEGHPWVLPFPLWSLNVQIPLLNGESGNTLVVGSIELCQVLGQGSQGKNRNKYKGIWRRLLPNKEREGLRS